SRVGWASQAERSEGRRRPGDRPAVTWTYSGDPSSTDRDAVRFLIGDTDTDDPQVSDEEIDYLLTSHGSVNAAALGAARAILARYSRLVDKSVGDLRLSYSQRVSGYKTLVASLQQRVAMAVATPFAGGLSKSQKESVEDDSDRVEPAFERDQFRPDGVLSGDDGVES